MDSSISSSQGGKSASSSNAPAFASAAALLVVAVFCKHDEFSLRTWQLLAVLGWVCSGVLANAVWASEVSAHVYNHICRCCQKRPRWSKKRLLYQPCELSQDFYDQYSDGKSWFETSTKICYCTDVEGHWHYFVGFVERCQALDFKNPGDHRNATDDVELELQPDWTFVFGGDTCDKGPGTLRFLKAVTQLKEKYPDRVFLLLGNRDINKIRWTSELHESEIDRLWEVPPGYWVGSRGKLSALDYVTTVAARAEGVQTEDGETPAMLREKNKVTRDMLLKHNSKKNRMCYFLKHDMGSDGEFEFRREELKHIHCRDFTDEEVVASYEESVGPDGLMTKYLRLAQIGVLLEGTLFVHGQIIGNQFSACKNKEAWALGVVPGRDEFVPDVRVWLYLLNQWAGSEIEHWQKSPHWTTPPTESTKESWDGRGGAALIEYGTPATTVPSVVYCRYLSESSMPIQYPQRLVEHLVLNGVHRVVVGHTPHGTAPTVIQHIGLTVVMGDTSFSNMRSNLAYQGDQRGDAVSLICIDNRRDVVQVFGQLPSLPDSPLQRVLDYEVMPLGHSPGQDQRPDPFVGRQDGQIHPDDDSEVYFVKARLPQIPGANGMKYLLSSVRGYQVRYKEVNCEDVEALTSASLGGLDETFMSYQCSMRRPERIVRCLSPMSASHHVEEIHQFGHDHLERDNMVEFFFNEVDLNGDGRLTSKELLDACTNAHVRGMLSHQFPGLNVEEIINKIDTTGSGQVRREDFISYMVQHFHLTHHC